MDWVDLSYLLAVSLAGGLARAVRRGLPQGWQLRLEARPAEGLKPGWIWLHAVSVGELVLAEGILGRLREQGRRVHITTGTTAGLGLLQKRLPTWDKDGGSITGGAFPLDDPIGLRPFLEVPPSAFVALETELWPNLLRVLRAKDIPCAIVNGRLTERTLEKGSPWLRRAASRLSVVAARDESSAEAFRRLGAPRVGLGGNLKADLPAPAPLHEGWSALRQSWTGKPVLVAGNTVEGEEPLVLEAWGSTRHAFPGLRLILAPRQPRRFQEVAALFRSRGLAFRQASDSWDPDPRTWDDTEVLLLDTLGELASAYREGTVALVGGGWNWTGGHNPLEPVRWGLPTIIGPGYANFEDLVGPLKEANLLRVVDGKALGQVLNDILGSALLRPEGNAMLPPSLCGALSRTCEVLGEILPSTS